MPTSLLSQPAARLAYSLLLWLLAATSALAQTTLTGRAIDEANQQGLSFANVVLKAATPDGKLVLSQGS